MKPKYSMKTRLIIRFSLLFGFLFLLVQGILMVGFRSLSLDAAKENALSVAELIRENITAFMVLDLSEKQDVFLKGIKDVKGIKSIHIVRGESVVHQFGNPFPGEKVRSDLEFRVLKTGTVQERLVEGRRDVEYTVVIPYKASSKGRINCLKCHEAKEGEVLGAVSLTTELTGRRRTGILTMIFTAVVALVFFGATFFVLYTFLTPYNDLFTWLRKGFNQISEGDFSEPGNDSNKIDSGEILHDYERMVGKLSQTLDEVSNKATILVGSQVYRTGNALKDTARTVEELVEIYKFKRIIEKDVHKDDIYLRLENVLERMNILNYSIYEVYGQRDSMKKICAYSDDRLVEMARRESVAGTAPSVEGPELPWCQAEILGNPQECRATRTGGQVDSREFPMVCPRFAYLDASVVGEIQHYCIPLFIGGQVGNVVQIVYGSDDTDRMKRLLPYLNSYFQEAAPVLEGKTFMEMMREQTLVDQLTGLYNRRFLDQLSSKMHPYAMRNQTQIGVLMIDVDFFKMVNDEYGHAAGDEVLKAMAQVIIQTVRENDLVVRYGGEEILVLLMGVDEGKSVMVAEKIRSNIENTSIEIPSGLIKKTVSVGVADFPTATDLFWQCVKYADVALYKAKTDGRNRVVCFTQDIWPDEKY